LKNNRVLILKHFAEECFAAGSEEESRLLNGHIQCETPLGILYVYTYAKEHLKKVEFSIIDGQALLLENAAKGMEWNWDNLISDIQRINPSIIGIGSYYYKAAPLFHETCRRIKEVLPEVIITTGGNYPSDAPKLVLNDDNVDYILFNEGEVIFTQFVETFMSGEEVKTLKGIAYKDSKGKHIFNEKLDFSADLSIMPIPDRTAVPMHLYGKGRNWVNRVYNEEYNALSMTVSRGCPYVCTFCTATNFWGRKIRYRDTETVLDEMQMLKEEYGADIILIEDDNFLIHKKKVSEILKGMIKRNLNLKWVSNGGSNVKILNSDDEYLDLVIKSGYCIFNLAIESSDDDTLRKIKKPLKISETVELIEKIRTRYPHLYINAFFIVGFPFETKQQILNTLEFSKNLELDWCSHFIFKPYPNTELFEYSLKKGIIDDYDLDFGEIYNESNINGDDWTNDWVFKKNYEYNLQLNFLNNRNLKIGNYKQALRDFEYVISIVPSHALAYRQAAIVAEKLNDQTKVIRYSEKEKSLLSEEGNDFIEWYEKLSITPYHLKKIIDSGLPLSYGKAETNSALERI